MDTAQNLETIFTDLHIDPTYSLLSLIDKGLPQLLINCKLSKCISLLHYDNIASSLMDESTNQEDIAGMVGMNAQLESILSKYQERAVNVAICMQEIRAISYEMIISMFERGRPLAPEELENVNAFMSKLFDAAETDAPPRPALTPAEFAGGNGEAERGKLYRILLLLIFISLEFSKSSSAPRGSAESAPSAPSVVIGKTIDVSKPVEKYTRENVNALHNYFVEVFYGSSVENTHIQGMVSKTNDRFSSIYGALKSQCLNVVSAAKSSGTELVKRKKSRQEGKESAEEAEEEEYGEEDDADAYVEDGAQKPRPLYSAQSSVIFQTAFGSSVSETMPSEHIYTVIDSGVKLGLSAIDRDDADSRKIGGFFPDSDAGAVSPASADAETRRKGGEVSESLMKIDERVKTVLKLDEREYLLARYVCKDSLVPELEYDPAARTLSIAASKSETVNMDDLSRMAETLVENIAETLASARGNKKLALEDLLQKARILKEILVSTYDLLLGFNSATDIDTVFKNLNFDIDNVSLLVNSLQKSFAIQAREQDEELRVIEDFKRLTLDRARKQNDIELMDLATKEYINLDTAAALSSLGESRKRVAMEQKIA
jgi:ribosomal protein L12E/L44/L45/RPP1/RPP2